MRRSRSCATAMTLFCLGLLCGCEPAPQPPGLLVETAPPGAACTVSRGGQQLATADPTPAITHFEPADGPLTVNCRRHGFADATVAVAPATAAQPTAVPDRVDIALVPLPPR